MKIEKIGIRANYKVRSKQIANDLKSAFSARGITITDDHPDLWIAVGGDGAFLRMVRENNFDTNTIYTGVHTGTLGFLQEIHPSQINQFIDCVCKGNITTQSMHFLVTKAHSKNRIETFYSLNEILVRHAALKTLKMEIRIDDIFLEKFAGDGMMVSTSVGSTAYNMSFGGAIVDNDFAVMQMTPIAPLSNKTYHTLRNSFVFPDTRTIEMIPQKPSISFTSDGDLTYHNGINKIEITTSKTPLKTIKFAHDDFVSKIQDKLLK